MELKDVLNRSNQTQLHLDRSIDVSYTEDQMLTALDSLNVDTRFSSDNLVLDEEAFVKALKDQDLGRASNLSLFDEIRLSFCNMSRRDTPDASGNISKLFEFRDACCDNLDTSNTGTQTDEISEATNNNLECDCTKICMECEKLQNHLMNVQNDLKAANNNVSVMQAELMQCEIDFKIIQKRLDQANVDKMASSVQTDDPTCSNCQEKTVECNKFKDSCAKLKIDLKKSQNRVSNAEKELIKSQLSLKTLQDYVDSLKIDQCSTGTQTETPSKYAPFVDNNNVEICGDCTKKCLDCDRLKNYTTKLEQDVIHAHNKATNMQLELDKYESTLNVLQKYIDENVYRNNFLETISQSLQAKLEVLESACAAQKEKIEGMNYETCCIESQTDYDVASVGTQAAAPCVQCEKRTESAPQRSIRRLLWEPLKCLFQAFAVLCFIFALSALYGVTRRSGCGERELPWRWLDAQEFMDLLLRIEYVADVPM